MSVYTREDLKVMQAWPLERKIQVTQAKILEWYYHYGGNVAVSYSAGKDSTVLLDLVRRAFPEVPAVFVDTGLEYPEIRDFARATPNVTFLRPEIPFTHVIGEHGYPIISKEVAHRLYYARRGSAWAVQHMRGLDKNGRYSFFNQRFIKWRFLLEAPFPISARCCDVMKKKPFHRYVRETGNRTITGTMACESVLRQNTYLKYGCNAFSKKEPTSQPMSFWLEQDVLRYLQMTRIPYSPIYGDIVEKNDKPVTTGAQRTGCMFCMFGLHLEKQPNRFQRMALTHPKQHNFCVNKLGCGKVLDYIGIPYMP